MKSHAIGVAAASLAALLGCAGLPTPPLPLSTEPLAVTFVDSPRSPYEPLVCSAPDATSVTWTRDGTPYLHTERTHVDGDTVPAGVVAAGETWSCTATAADGRTGTADVMLPVAPGNVLILIADDLGVDKVRSYGIAEDTPELPTIERLTAQGVLFENAYAYSSCSPTRAATLTGRYGTRTGLTDLLGARTPFELPLAEVTLPEMLAASPHADYASAALGKWHMGWFVSGPTHPMDQGFDMHAGSRGNLNVKPSKDYFRWQKFVDGQPRTSTTYATIDTTDDAIAQLQSLREPWVAWVAYNAPHYPFHDPPKELVQSRANGDKIKQYDAMALALDKEMGRLLDSLSEKAAARTHVIFVGDNGTARPGIAPPFESEEGKQTPYEGGIHVPMIITGPLVATPGTRSSALVSVLDIFPTVAAQAGVRLDQLTRTDGTPVVLDGMSLAPFLADPSTPGRELLFLEQVEGVGGDVQSIIDIVQHPRYKLIVFPDHEEFFDKDSSLIDEGENLLAKKRRLAPEAQAALDTMRAFRATTRAGLQFENASMQR